MNAIYLTLFVSLILVLLFALMFGALFVKRTHEHSDRLSLLPLEEEGTARWGAARQALPDEGGREGPPLNDKG